MKLKIGACEKITMLPFSIKVTDFTEKNRYAAHPVSDRMLIISKGAFANRGHTAGILEAGYVPMGLRL